MPRGGDRLERAGRDEVDADAVRADVARQVARDRLECRLADAHPVVDRPGDRRVEVEPDDGAAASASSGSRPAVERLEREGARLERRRARSPAACRRKSPPSASAGANAIACSTPSSRPQRSSQLAATAARSLGGVDVELEHVDRLGQPRRGALGQPPGAAEAVSTTSAPAAAPARRRARRSSRSSSTPVIEQLAAVEHHSGTPRRSSGVLAGAASARGVAAPQHVDGEPADERVVLVARRGGRRSTRPAPSPSAAARRSRPAHADRVAEARPAA